MMMVVGGENVRWSLCTAVTLTVVIHTRCREDDGTDIWCQKVSYPQLQRLTVIHTRCRRQVTSLHKIRYDCTSSRLGTRYKLQLAQRVMMIPSSTCIHQACTGIYHRNNTQSHHTFPEPANTHASPQLHELSPQDPAWLTRTALTYTPPRLVSDGQGREQT